MTDSTPSHPMPTQAGLAMLTCLREAVAEALEQKRRLGQFWVEDSPEGPVFRGPGAPGPKEGKAGKV